MLGECNILRTMQYVSIVAIVATSQGGHHSKRSLEAFHRVGVHRQTGSAVGND
jgi:hypothetical protein